MEEASLDNLFLVQFAIFIIIFQFLFTLTTEVLYAFIIPKYFVFGADRNEVCLVTQYRVQTWRRGWRAEGLMIEMHHTPLPPTKKSCIQRGSPVQPQNVKPFTLTSHFRQNTNKG